MRRRIFNNPVSGWKHSVLLAAWTIFTLVSATLFFAGIRPEYFQNVWTAAMMYPANLKGMGVSTPLYGAFQTGMDVLLASAFLLIGLLIFIHGWKDWMLILISLTSISFGMLFIPTLNILADWQPVWTIPVAVIRAFGLASSIITGFYIFPDGRFVPKMTRWLSAIWGAMVVAWLLFPGLPANLVYISTWSDNIALSFGLYGIWYLTGVIAQLHRYRHVSGPVEKQQTKWVVLGTSGAVAAFFFFNIPMVIFPQLNTPGYPHLMYSFLAKPVYVLVTAFVPVSIAISILKYRLWEVDRLINRSLVYGFLTLFLGLVYAGMVLVLRSSLLGFSNNSSTITVILSTLAVAAMFTPVRNFIQAWIDRRFFRKKYDTERTLEQFRMSLRNRVDINSLSRELLGLVDKTIQPESISLWLVSGSERGNGTGVQVHKVNRKWK